MKFTQAWAKVASQNSVLKFVVTALIICTIALSVTTVKLAVKEPLIIERTCFNRAVQTAPTEHTQAEVDTFVRAAIAARFNSDAQAKSQLLSIEEGQIRSQEQSELTSKGMSQRVLVNAVKIEGQTATIDADRLISAGQIRSAFIFPLKLTFLSEIRSEANPYGLVLTKVEQSKIVGEKHE